MKRWNIGLSACGRENLPDELFESYRQAGLKCMEISLRFPGSEENISADERFSWYTALDTEKIRRLTRESGVEVWSMHLPFGHTWYNIASLNEEQRLYTVEKNTEIIKLTAKIGAKIAVIHPSGEPIEDCNRGRSMELAKDSLAKLAEAAKENNVILAVENLPRTCLGRNSDEIKELLEADPDLKVCFDVNHLLEESHKDFINNVGDKIVTLHISDYDFVDERHWIPGKGKIDWQELIDLLKNAGYTGPFMNELGCRLDWEDTNMPTHQELFDANKELLDRYF